VLQKLPSPFCSLQKVFFWRFNILFSTQTRQICVELAKLKFQDSSRPLMRKSFFAMKRGEIERVKPVFLSLSQPSAQAEHSHTRLAWLCSTFTHTFVLLQLRSHSHSSTYEEKSYELMASSRERRKAFFGARTTVSAPPPPLSRGKKKILAPRQASTLTLSARETVFYGADDGREKTFFIQLFSTLSAPSLHTDRLRDCTD